MNASNYYYILLNTATPGYAIQLVLPYGNGYFVVPAGWSNTDNKIELIGGGAGGSAGYGGGGGAYAAKNNLAVSSNSSLLYQVGYGAGRGTWIVSNTTVYAEGGGAAGSNSQGGRLANSVGDVVYSGGDGYANTYGGGGGAGGPNGNGLPAQSVANGSGGAGDAGYGGAGGVMPYANNGAPGDEWASGIGSGGGAVFYSYGGFAGGGGGAGGGGVGGNGVIVISYNPTDGSGHSDTWLGRYAMSPILCIAGDANGNFVALCNSSYIIYSEPGTNSVFWSATTAAAYPNRMTNAGVAFGQATYGPEQFVAVYSNSTSSGCATFNIDTLGWNNSSSIVTNTMPVNTTWTDITFSDGVFVAVSTTGQTAIYDGNTWISGGNLVTVGHGSSTWNAVAAGNGIIVAVSNAIPGHGAANNISISNNQGTSWTINAGYANNAWTDITFGNGIFILVPVNSSSGGSTSNGQIAIKTANGNVWTPITLPAVANGGAIAYGNGEFVIVTSNSNVAMVTKDNGTSWSTETLPPLSTISWNGIGYGGNKFATFSTNSSYIAVKEF